MSYRIRAPNDTTDFQLFESLKDKVGHLSEGYFIAESPKVVAKVLESSLVIRAAFLTQGYFERHEAELQNRLELIEITIAPKERMEQIVGYPLHQGVMLAVMIPEAPSLETLLAMADRPHTIVALDSIADAENMGTIIRTCAAFGVTGLLVDSQSCHPFLRRSVRVSMGTVVQLPILRVQDLLPSLGDLKKRRYKIIGTAVNQKSQQIERASISDNVVFVFGAEGHGLRPAIAEACDSLMRIPISGDVDSLNVGIACGIFLYERSRQLC